MRCGSQISGAPRWWLDLLHVHHGRSSMPLMVALRTPVSWMILEPNAPDRRWFDRLSLQLIRRQIGVGTVDGRLRRSSTVCNPYAARYWNTESVGLHFLFRIALTCVAVSFGVTHRSRACASMTRVTSATTTDYWQKSATSMRVLPWWFSINAFTLLQPACLQSASVTEVGAGQRWYVGKFAILDIKQLTARCHPSMAFVTSERGQCIAALVQPRGRNSKVPDLRRNRIQNCECQTMLFSLGYSST